MYVPMYLHVCTHVTTWMYQCNCMYVPLYLHWVPNVFENYSGSGTVGKVPVQIPSMFCKVGSFLASIFLTLVFKILLTVHIRKICRLLDLNRGPRALEAIAPNATEPQPLAIPSMFRTSTYLPSYKCSDEMTKTKKLKHRNAQFENLPISFVMCSTKVALVSITTKCSTILS